jgi:hypothetical protein
MGSQQPYYRKSMPREVSLFGVGDYLGLKSRLLWHFCGQERMQLPISGPLSADYDSGRCTCGKSRTDNYSDLTPAAQDHLINRCSCGGQSIALARAITIRIVACLATDYWPARSLPLVHP